MRDRINNAAAILGILGVFVLWAVYTAGVGYLIERNLPDRSAPLAQTVKRRAAKFVPSRKTCMAYPMYPDTIICPNRKMYHHQRGGWSFMADLTVPKHGLPRPRPVEPVNRGRVPRRALTADAGYELLAIEPRVSAWVGKPVIVNCENMGPGGYGAYGEGPPTLWLGRSLCNPLMAMLGGGHQAPLRQGVGLITIAHEMLHARGLDNEALTECVAFQIVDNLGLSWGVRRHWLSKLLGYAYRDHRALVAHTPMYANQRRCRENGAWDQTPFDGRWP